MGKLVFAKNKDQGVQTGEAGAFPWKVLIVDDDPEVHVVTEVALRNVSFHERRLEFLHAYSAGEAQNLISCNSDIALILLDVVMETDDAGLQFVEFVRNELGNTRVRIVLRTGQPGQAPEADVIVRYDINDYKAKTELTQQKLFTTVVTALRGYRDITAIEASREGLQKIIEASASLMRSRSLQIFASGVLTQLGGLLGSVRGGILCTQSAPDDASSLHLLAASGCFEPMLDSSTLDGLADTISSRIKTALSERKTIAGPDYTLLYLRTPNARDMVVYIEADSPLNALDRQLVEVFGANISVGFDNLEMFDELLRSNEDLHQRVEERTRDLHERESRLRAILEASPVGVALVRLSDSSPLFANSRLSQIFGLPPGSLCEASSVPEKLGLELWPEIVVTLRHEGVVNDVEIPLSPSPARSAWGLLSARVMSMDGEAVALIWIYDITRLKLLEQELTHHATTDHLTGIFNRRHFLVMANLELARANRYGHNLTLLMMDIDRFKSINDTYGHEAGDRVICAMTDTCVAVLRSHDLVGRVGGEEFAAALPESDVLSAARVAERLRKEVEGLAVLLEDGRTVRFTVSIGVAELQPGETSVDAALSRADGALYNSKRSGRNRVSVSTRCLSSDQSEEKVLPVGHE